MRNLVINKCIKFKILLMAAVAILGGKLCFSQQTTINPTARINRVKEANPFDSMLNRWRKF